MAITLEHSATGLSEDTSTRADRIRALFGSAIEWYDFFLYGTMSAIVFGNLFFPSANPLFNRFGV